MVASLVVRRVGVGGVGGVGGGGGVGGLRVSGLGEDLVAAPVHFVSAGPWIFDALILHLPVQRIHPVYPSEIYIAGWSLLDGLFLLAEEYAKEAEDAWAHSGLLVRLVYLSSSLVIGCKRCVANERMRTSFYTLR